MTACPGPSDSPDDLVGTWDVTIGTPIGSIEVVYDFRVSDGGHIVGTAAGRDEEVPLEDVVIERGDDGRRVRWRQSVRRPIRLDLAFDVVVDTGSMVGHSRAGRLPRSAVRGRRRVP